MATADKLSYLLDTKAKIKNAINNDISLVNDDTIFREYADKINSLSDTLKKYIPTEILEGTSLHITNAAPLNAKSLIIDGNSYQFSTKGINLFNYTKINSSIGGLENVLNDDGSITTSGKIMSNYVFITNRLNITNMLENGQNYILFQSKPNVYIYIQLRRKKLSGNWEYIYDFKNEEISFNADKDNFTDYEINIQTGNTSAWGDEQRTITQKYMLYKDIGEEIEWEPYTGGGVPSPNPDFPQEIEVYEGGVEVKVNGKNLFKPTLIADDGETIFYTNADVNLENDIYTLTCKNGYDMYFGQIANKGIVYNGIRGNLIDVSNCSKISFSLSNNLFNKNFITYYDENKISLGFSQFNSSKGTYTIPNGVKYISFRFGLHATIGTSYQTKVQLEYDMPTDYEQYKGQTTNIDLQDNFIGKIGDVKDRLYIQNGHAYLEKNIGKVVLNGSEAWASSGALAIEGYYRYTLTMDTLISSNKIITNSNYFVGITYDQRNSNVLNTIYGNGNIGINTNVAKSTNEFKAWLSNNPIIIYYVLETSQIIQLEPLKIKMYEGTNNIELISNLETNMSLEYYKTNKVIE